VRYLPNGHDQDPLPSEAPAEHSALPTILWYTRFTEASPQRAAHLFAPLLQADPQLRLAVLGEEIAEGARAALGVAFAGLRVDLQVDWLGYHPEGIERYLAKRQGQVVAAYPMDDDAVNRARCPSKVPQLMAMGIPVVAEAVGELNSYLAGFESECLVTPGHGDVLRTRLASLLAQPDRRLSLGADLQQAADRWRWERTAAGLLDWYRDVVHP
jgi:glycosyltransferase involved in cell wall biosynthesis